MPGYAQLKYNILPQTAISQPLANKNSQNANSRNLLCIASMVEADGLLLLIK
jgi:hypothetical protein